MAITRATLDTDMGTLANLITTLSQNVTTAIAKNNDFTAEDTQVQSMIQALTALNTQVTSL